MRQFGDVGQVNVVDAERQRSGRRVRARHDMMGGSEDLPAHGKVDAVATPIRHRADTHVFDVTARRGCELSTPPLARLDRHMPVRRDTQHGTARTRWYASKDREDQVETGHVEEDGSHST